MVKSLSNNFHHSMESPETSTRGNGIANKNHTLVDPYEPNRPDRIYKLDPLPFRYGPKPPAIDNSTLDVSPNKQNALKLRPRDKDKELAHNFRFSDVTSVDRLNRLYEDYNKILDCEVLSKSPKKRLT